MLEVALSLAALWSLAMTIQVMLLTSRLEAMDKAQDDLIDSVDRLEAAIYSRTVGGLEAYMRAEKDNAYFINIDLPVVHGEDAEA